MSEPLVSVIIGTYNREAFIEETLAGVIAQTFDAYEIIVVDDASTDRTLEILRGYGDRIRLIERKTNSGTADVPRYQAVEAARGSYCALLDSDDLWKPDKLARQIEFMQSHPEIELSHTYMEII
ncbi:MAG: glycosyltransferase family 2 protein, partial [Verrucomicrobiota bacterium]